MQLRKLKRERRGIFEALLKRKDPARKTDAIELSTEEC
jgi:hypothetical protein